MHAGIHSNALGKHFVLKASAECLHRTVKAVTHYVVCTASEAIDSRDSMRTVNIRVYVSSLLTQLFHTVEYYATVRTVFGLYK